MGQSMRWRGKYFKNQRHNASAGPFRAEIYARYKCEPMQNFAEAEFMGWGWTIRVDHEPVQYLDTISSPEGPREDPVFLSSGVTVYATEDEARAAVEVVLRAVVEKTAKALDAPDTEPYDEPVTHITLTREEYDSLIEPVNGIGFVERLFMDEDEGKP